ncbi:MAG: ATP-grasp fold amidoligase family protein [Planctomycetota bacterium]
MSDEAYIRAEFKRAFGRPPDLQNPKTLNEKIQWLKLYDRTPLHTRCADKYAVREYVAERAGPEYLVPLLYHTENPADIAPENLPSPPFVIKTNHAGSAGMTFVRDKSEIDWHRLRKLLARELKKNYYYERREWQYKNIRPRILVERMLQDEAGNSPADYKLYAFNGRFAFAQVDLDRHTRHKRNLYDSAWRRIPCEWLYPNGPELKRPPMLDTMRAISETIGEEFAMVRVDSYVCDGQLYVGELTFHPESGCAPFAPDEWDRKLGDMLTLPHPNGKATAHAR